MYYNKRAFTLVELLAVIAILGVLLVTFIPSFLNSISNKKGDALEKVYNLIESAALNYSIDYNLESPTIINLDELCDLYIKCPIINPSTEEELNGFLYVDNGYKYYESGEAMLTIDSNGGKPEFEPQKYQSASIITLENLTKENADFKGWQVVKGNSILNGNKLIIGNQDTILHAKWETYKTLTVNGGSTTQTFKEAYKSGAVIELIPPTKEGYKFTGWTANGGILSGNIFTMGEEDVILTANFAPLVVQALYSETDNSLMFIYDRQYSVGETYNGKAVTAVYTGFETQNLESTAIPWYSYRTSIKKVEVIDTIKPYSLENWFREMTACTEMNLDKLDVSNTVSISKAFKGASAITTLDLSAWKTTTSLKWMDETFTGMSNLTTLDVSNFNTSNVRSMYNLFYNSTKLTSLDLSKWDTSKVTTMTAMFRQCQSLSKLDLSNFNTNSVTGASHMFQGVGQNVTTNFELKLGDNFNLSNVQELQYMFNNAGYNSKTCTIDLGSNFDTSGATNMSYMFTKACNKSTTTTINLGNEFDTGNVTNMIETFSYIGASSTNFVLDLGDKFMFKDGVVSENIGHLSGVTKLIIPETVTNIPPGTFRYMNKLKEIVFEHSSTAIITFPTPGVSTGAFFANTTSVLSTTITTTNQSVKNYAWVTDNRTATFK